MASISNDPNGRRRILFVAPDGSRRTIRLGKIDRKTAESIGRHVEALLGAKMSGQPIPRDTAAWLANIEAKLRDKLAAVGLIAAEHDSCVALSDLIERYQREREASNKQSTLTNLGLVVKDLDRVFGLECDIRRITIAGAVGFLNHYKERGLAPSTIARRLRRVKAIFAYAVKRKLLAENPFAEVKILATQPAEREAYLTLEDTQKLLDVAPPDWRVIIALARYAGLRCPSEVLSLRWQDIDFATDRMAVTSPKTAHLPGKEYRIVPLFADLRPHLEEAFELAPEGAEYVISRPWADQCRQKALGPSGWVSVNLRTQMARLVRRAGLPPWPRMFNTLRASASTDIRNTYGEVAESAWVGHSPAIARRHYSRIPEALFKMASRKAAQNPAHQGAQNTAQQATARSCTQESLSPQVVVQPKDTPFLAEYCDSVQCTKLTLSGFEPEFPP